MRFIKTRKLVQQSNNPGEQLSKNDKSILPSHHVMLKRGQAENDQSVARFTVFNLLEEISLGLRRCLTILFLN